MQWRLFQATSEEAPGTIPTTRFRDANGLLSRRTSTAGGGRPGVSMAAEGRTIVCGFRVKKQRTYPSAERAARGDVVHTERSFREKV